MIVTNNIAKTDQMNLKFGPETFPTETQGISRDLGRKGKYDTVFLKRYHAAHKTNRKSMRGHAAIERQ